MNLDNTNQVASDTIDSITYDLDNIIHITLLQNSDILRCYITVIDYVETISYYDITRLSNIIVLCYGILVL